MHFYFLFTFIFNAISTLDLVRKRTLALEEGPIKESFQCQVYILTHRSLLNEPICLTTYFEEFFHPAHSY